MSIGDPLGSYWTPEGPAAGEPVPTTPPLDEELPAYADQDVPPEDEETPPEADPADVAAADSLHASFLAWVTKHLATLEPKEECWCPEWWLHPEAVARLRVSWLAWVELSNPEEDLSSTSSWWVQHWDHHARYLFNRTDGPFRECDSQRGHLVKSHSNRAQIQVAAPPEDWRP